MPVRTSIALSRHSRTAFISNLSKYSKVYHHRPNIITLLGMTQVKKQSAVGQAALPLVQQAMPLTHWIFPNSVKPYVICGPSGSGKTTLMQMLFDKYKDCFAFCVSHTTRKPRMDEVRDKSYHFIDMITFEKMIANNEFAEYSRFSNNLYGTSFKELETVRDSGKIAILDLDIRGVISLKNAKFDAKYMFITSPTLNHLEQNLRKRGSEDNVTLKTRLTHAIEDTKTAQDVTFDVVIVNSDLEQAFEQLLQAVNEDVKKLLDSRAKNANWKSDTSNTVSGAGPNKKT